MKRVEKITRLANELLYDDNAVHTAETFLLLFEKIREIEHEEAEERRVARARKMSQRSQP